MNLKNQRKHNLIKDLDKFEADKLEFVAETNLKIRCLEAEIQYLRQRANAQSKPTHCGTKDFNIIVQQYLTKKKIKQLMDSRNTHMESLMYYPYEYKPTAHNIQGIDETFNNIDETFNEEFEQNVSCNIRFHNPTRIVQGKTTAVRKLKPAPQIKEVDIEKMVAYQYLFASIDAAHLSLYDIKFMEEIPEELIKHDEDIDYVANTAADVSAVLASLKFNTSDLLRQDLAHKSYYTSLVTLGDQHKTFHVLLDTLRRKVQTFYLMGEADLQLPKHLREELLATAEKLLNMIAELEQTYATLFKVSGLEDVQTTMFTPKALKPYEKVHRFVEETALTRLVFILRAQNQTMKNVLQNPDIKEEDSPSLGLNSPV